MEREGGNLQKVGWDRQHSASPHTVHSPESVIIKSARIGRENSGKNIIALRPP